MFITLFSLEDQFEDASQQNEREEAYIPVRHRRILIGQEA
jgi:hypothetical protein